MIAVINPSKIEVLARGEESHLYLVQHRPRPLLHTKLFAAVLSVPSLTTEEILLNPNSFAKLIKPLALVTPSTIPYNSASALLKAKAPE